MIAALAAMLVGFCVPYFLGRKVSERFPQWTGVAASFSVACVVGECAVVALAFGGGWLWDHGLRMAADMRVDIGSWVRIVMGQGTVLALVGAIVGTLHGRRRAIVRRDALTELARMRDYPRD